MLTLELLSIMLTGGSHVFQIAFVGGRYSGDWSRIGALSRETEAQLRTTAYVVVPVSAALVWVIGKRKRIP